MLMPFASQTPLIQFVIEATAKERAKGRPFGGPFSDTVAGLVNMAMVIMAASAFHEGHSDVAEIELAFMIDGAPEIAELAVDLHERLIQMPTPLRIEAHVRYPLLSDLGGEHPAKPVPPKRRDDLVHRADGEPAGPYRSHDRPDRRVSPEYADVRPARARRRPDGRHLVHRQFCRLHRQARPRFREDCRIQTAGSERARSAHAALRSKRRPLVHCAKRQHGWTSRSKDRTDQACYLAHPQIQSLRASDRFKGRAVLLRIRREQAREPRSDNDGNPRILSAARR